MQLSIQLVRVHLLPLVFSILSILDRTTIIFNGLPPAYDLTFKFKFPLYRARDSLRLQDDKLRDRSSNGRKSVSASPHNRALQMMVLNNFDTSSCRVIGKYRLLLQMNMFKTSNNITFTRLSDLNKWEFLCIFFNMYKGVLLHIQCLNDWVLIFSGIW